MQGFSAEGVAFLRDLKKNNNREWFLPRRDLYKELVRGPMVQLVHGLHVAMLEFAPAYVGEPEKCVYRVYRDVRFSKDKTPYKTGSEALFWRNSLDKNSGAAFYISVSPERVVVAGGLYMAQPDALLAVRRHIAENGAAFRATFESGSVRKLMGGLAGEQLTRVPKGFSAEHPDAALLRHKQFILHQTLDAAMITTPRLQREIVKRFQELAPFVKFLDQPLLKAGRRKPAHAFG